MKWNIFILLTVTVFQLNLAQKLTGNFQQQPFPQEAIDYADQGNIDIQTKSVDILGTKVHYLEAKPGNVLPAKGKTLYLLHGAAFTSNTWTTLNPGRRQIDTIPKMAAAGFNVVAVDLPGFGRTRSSRMPRGEFLAALVEATSPTKNAVIVSPSMSGSFALPLLVSRPDLFCGYVPVAPGSAFSYRGRLGNVNVPTLIVVGERDGFGSSKILEEIPTSSEIQVIPNAGHPAYLDDPKLWHQLLYNFMDSLQC